MVAYQHYQANKPNAPRLLWPGEIGVLPLSQQLLTSFGLNLPSSPPRAEAESFSQLTLDPHVTVDISHQSLTAYDGKVPVLMTSIASGRYGFDTPLGTFPLVKKYETYRYVSPFPNRVRYNLGDVPWNMLIEPGAGVFLHGAYWHSDFGRRHSSGCVNMNLDDASWLYHWAPLGTPVTIIP